MKRAMIMAAMVVGLSVNAQVVRVRNQPVDLTPVVQWFGKRSGERPMPHWKVIEIVHVMGTGWGGYRVSVKADGADAGIKVIQNIPAVIIQWIQADQATLNEMASIEVKLQQLELMTAEVERKQALIAWDDPAYALNRSTLAANRALALSLNQRYEALRGQLAITGKLKKAKFLAFNTGQKVGGYEVWDCGVGSQVLSVNTD